MTFNSTEGASSRENKNPSIILINLDEADDTNLQSQIQAASGEIIVIVHPYDGVREKSEDVPNDTYALDIVRFMRVSTARTSPVVFFEEKERVDELSTTLCSLGLTGKAFVVKTIPENPDPISGSLELIATRLKALGATKVLMAGSLLGYNQPNNEGFEGVSLTPTFARRWQMNELDGCVGGAATEFMKQGLDVTFSRATYPRTLQQYSRQ